MDLALFPKNEEWGTGDEALDLKLNTALKKAVSNLSLESINEFYVTGKTLKTRTFNPAFSLTIDFVVKALLFYFAPEDYNDYLMKKIKGDWFSKKRIPFGFSEANDLTKELKEKMHVRFQNHIDFFLHPQNSVERNPFVKFPLLKSPYDMSAKIIFKELKFFLNNEVDNAQYHHPLLMALKDQSSILVVDNFAELWYHNDQIFSLSLIAH